MPTNDIMVPILAPKDSWYKGSYPRSSITEIQIVSATSITEQNSDEFWYADINDSGSIMCYRVGSVLTIVAGDGSRKIALSEDASYTFSDSTREDCFTSLTSITGLDMLLTGNVTNMEGMFRDAVLLETIEVNNFDTSNVTSMKLMFSGSSTNGDMALKSIDVSNWDMSRVETVYAMFQKCTSLTAIDTSSWVLSSCTDASGLFVSCKSLVSVDVSNFGLGACTSMLSMFQGCEALTSIVGISDIDTSSCTNMASMFYGCKSITELDLHKWDVSKVTTMNRMFGCPAANNGYGATGNLVSVDTTGWDVSSCTNMGSMFNAQGKLVEVIGFNTWIGTSACTNLGWMFWTCSSLKKIDMSNFDTRNVISFHHLFCHDSSLTEIVGLSDLDLSSAESLNAMLHSTRITSLDVSKWNTSKVKDFSQFLEGNSVITEIIGLENLDTNSVKACGQMFGGCSNLRRLNLSTFNTTQVNTTWQDPYRNEAGMGIAGMLSGLVRLESITVGENFSFNGDGSLSKVVLPTPDATYIPETKGVWYNADTLQSYTSAEIPNKTSATYSCVGVDVMVKHTTLIDIAEEVKRLNGSTEKIKPSDMVTILSELELGSGGDIGEEASDALDTILVMQEELIG
jgi:surface protein